MLFAKNFSTTECTYLVVQKIHQNLAPKELFMIDISNSFGYIGITFLIAAENIFPPIPFEVIQAPDGLVTGFLTYTIIEKMI